jgi:hypothetical protein
VNVSPLCSGGQFGPPKAALVQGDYKLLCYCFSVEGIDNATSTGCQDDPDFPGLFPLLYNITADPSETTNLASQFPDVVKSMEARLGVLALESVEPMQVRLCAAMGKKGKGSGALARAACRHLCVWLMMSHLDVGNGGRMGYPLRSQQLTSLPPPALSRSLCFPHSGPRRTRVLTTSARTARCTLLGRVPSCPGPPGCEPSSHGHRHGHRIHAHIHTHINQSINAHTLMCP